MNPIYRFELNGGRACRPLYKDDLSKDYELQSNEQYVRAKLSGNLIFAGADYQWIVGRVFDYKFELTIYVSYDAGSNWTNYWSGNFWKTDCDFDEDNKTVTVKLTVKDQYTDVLSGMDKEYNLIDLMPEIMPVKADKRPMIQIYIPGQSVISCFVSGSWWEQDCDVVEESDVIEIDGQEINKLAGYYMFNLLVRERIISTEGSNVVPDVFMGSAPSVGANLTYQNGAYLFQYRQVAGSGYVTYYWEIARASDNVVMWRYSDTSAYITPWDSSTYVLSPVSGTGASGDIYISWRDIAVYARYICDVDTLNNVPLFPIPADDICSTNLNYHFMFPYGRTGVIYFSSLLSAQPTKWGLYSPGRYYQRPSVFPNPELFPVSRATWGRASIWFAFFRYDYADDVEASKEFTIKHSYPIASVISVLLKQFAPDITHDATPDCSQFLYGGQNLIGTSQSLFIVPKSNLVTAGYDQPAQKAIITLRDVLNMLRDCFRCFWFIDDQKRFRIEHIQFFRNGGSYSGEPIVGIDLTQMLVARNGKEWSFATSKFSFDKPEMAARYQFGWMDGVTRFFEGFPIDIISGYVNPDNIEQVVVSKFTSDIDYILMNPSGVSKDGFALLAAVVDSSVVQDVDINTGDITSCGSRIGATGKWETDSVATYYGGLVDVTKYRGLNYQIVSGGGGSYAFVKSGVSLGNDVDFATGWSGYELLPDGTIATGTVPADARYLYVYLQSPGVSYRPQAITFYGATINTYKLPYVTHMVNSTEYRLQNGYVSFLYLQQYYAYDMPAKLYSIDGVQKTAIGVKRLKKQRLTFPVFVDPDFIECVKTNLGNGVIEKLSVNLSSRNANATLKYDTE